ncbi:MAG TPA: PrsW family intramembrane metalloprotease [Solirubrobacteraceae bacterium]|jgi:RsiW-degrading membrane proteinase PrsW (M82 family)|nr:PrsW family intramembrane metalloprotease [Solirubrobacteraceae bacterium]
MAAAQAPPRPSVVARVFRAALVAALVVAMLTAGLAVLAVAGAETGGVAFGLAICLAVLPVPVYLAIVLWIDRYEPEPLPMIALTFAWGATAACFFAIVLNTVGEAIVAEQLGTRASEVYGSSFSAPVIEEVAKAAVLFGVYRWRRSEFNGVVDGIVYAALVGLGFAMTENVLYYGRGAAEEGIPGAVGTFVARGVLSPFAHPVFTAMTGIGLGIAAGSRWRGVRAVAPLAGLGAAIALHSVWNTAAGAGLFFAVYLLIMVPLFLALMGVVALALHREGRLIAAQLRGLLPDREVEALASLRARRHARREAARRGGRPARRAMADLQQVAAELAFHRDQTRRGVVRADRLAQARESALVARMAARRRELARLGR